MMPAVAILGGSTPFTAALVEALRDSALPPCELRLFGTDSVALERMRGYVECRLEWPASTHRRLDEAIDGAAIVLNQIRFGGLQERARDEERAAVWRVPADETLGPCGLAAALRIAAPVHALATSLRCFCPGARVLNLCNPVSITTALLGDAIGICELPCATALETCRVLRCDPSEVEWKYAGLNHRGVIFSFRHRGEELMPRMPDLLGEQTIFGITPGEIRRIGALPLKYYALTRPDVAPVRRAQFLARLKEDIAHEIDAGVLPPPSLRRRSFEWYSGAVVPALAALLSETPHEMVVNLRGSGDVVRETHAALSSSAVIARPAAPPEAVQSLLHRWEAHERAVLDAVAAPSLAGIERALGLDPIVPQHRARQIARDIWINHAQ